MKKYLIGTIIFSLAFSSFLFSFQRIRAAGLEVPTSEELQRRKETGIVIKVWRLTIPVPFTSWDSLAWLAANIAIRVLVDDTVKWINSGFNGNPFYVTNPGDFLMDTADQASGLFLAKLKLTGLCSNWAPRLEIALRTQVPFQQRMQCTLSKVVKNIEAFEKDFLAGGWAGWIEMTQAPRGNIYGAYLEASDEMARQILNAQNQAQTKANWGKGFLSQEVCNAGTVNLDTFCNMDCGGIEGDEERSNCMDNCQATYGNASEKTLCETSGGEMEIQTPGTTIENRLTQALGSDVQKLVSADEFNEILSALFSQLIQKGIGAIGKAVAGGGGKINNFSNTPEAVVEGKLYFDGLKTNALETISGTIAGETQYRDIKQDSLNTIGDIISKLQSCLGTDSRMTSYESKKPGIRKDIEDANKLIAVAGLFKPLINLAPTSEKILDIMDDYNNQIMGLMQHSADDMDAASQEYSTLQGELSQINEECSTGPTTP